MKKGACQPASTCIHNSTPVCAWFWVSWCRNFLSRCRIDKLESNRPSASNKLLQILAFNGGHDWLFALLDYETVGRLATCSRTLSRDLTNNGLWRRVAGLADHSTILADFIQRTVPRRMRAGEEAGHKAGIGRPPTPTHEYAAAREKALAELCEENSRTIWKEFAPYLAAVRRSPPPTKAQVERFAETGVCDAHSWYKKLSSQQDERFFVFLNPFAGLRHNGKEYERIVADSPHYNSRTTDNWRGEYGMLSWTYGDHGMVQATRNLQRPNKESTVLNFPPCVLAFGGVMLSRYCHRDADPPQWQHDPDDDGTTLGAELNSVTAAVERVKTHEAAGRSATPRATEAGGSEDGALQSALRVLGCIEMDAGEGKVGAWLQDAVAAIREQLNNSSWRRNQRVRELRNGEPTSAHVVAWLTELCYCRQRQREVQGIVDAVNRQVGSIYGQSLQ